MVSRTAQPASRYRRRILGLGALATGALYVIGAPIFNGRIESDLEARVPDALAAAGFAGLDASFSGQDGTITCVAPLDDPEGARGAAYDVRGVRSIELDRSCRVNTGDAEPTPVTTIENGGADGSIASSDSDNARASTPSTVADTEPDVTSPDSDLATIADIVAADADLAFLSLLLAESDVDVSDGRITLFAPNDAAFDAVPSDLLERLQNDRDLLDDVLAHHVVDGVYTTADLVDGELTASDGQMLEVTTGTEIAVGGATLVGTDTIASNGVVHVVDSLILPPDAVTRAAGDTSATAVRYDGEKVVLTGVVASEVDRQVLIGAAAAATSPDLVIDELTVDPDTGAGAMLAERLGALISAMPANLRSGEVGFDGTDVYAGGIMRSEVGRDAFIAAAAAVDVEADVVVPPQATDDDAAELETQLNAVVAENPILFEPSSAVLSASALPVIDRIAADAQQFDGLQITVEGHTDSDGAPIENLQLSQNRAQAVQAALVERGLDADVVEAVGFGSERPVIVDGTEDKGASRRVEFRVITAP